jgi:nitroimidazol reductase NimA-like FMN-containing flavoprotein (pyridoxamine 5'-phosphate oxidase superfamily)
VNYLSTEKPIIPVYLGTTMEIVENTLDAGLADFLARPLFCHLATASENGPRASPLWFLWEDEAIWLIATRSTKTFPERIEEEPRTAISIVDFDPETGRVQHVGLRGRATVEPFDGDRGERLLSQYLGEDKEEWDEQFRGLGEATDNYAFVRFVPETVVARDQSYSGSLAL